jgi:hypothetical protein
MEGSASPLPSSVAGEYGGQYGLCRGRGCLEPRFLLEVCFGEDRVAQRLPHGSVPCRCECSSRCRGGGVVVPVFTPFVSLLSKHRAQYSNRAKFLVPPYDSLMQAHDKEACYRIATDLGIPAPSTRFPREEGVDPQDPGALQEWARDLAYP